MTKSKPSSVKLPEPGWAETKAAKTPATPPDRDGRDLTIDDLYELHLPGDPRVSPDRNTILTTVQTIDHDADEYRAALWIMDPDGSNQRRLSSGQWRDTAPRWSPNGNWIAFRSKRDGDDKIQLYVMPVNGGEPTRVTALEHGITDHCWSPDSRRLVVVSQVDMPDENASDSDSVRVITSAHYKFNGTGFRDDRFTHLFVVDRTRPDDDACQLTEGRFLHRSPAWSPDGRLIAFVANRDPNWDVSRVSDVWTIPANGGESRRLTDGEESWRHPAWSPDGAMLAVLGETQLGSTYTNTLLGLLPVSGGPLRTISASTDRAIGDSSMSAPRGDVSGPTMRWTPDGSAIDALVSDRGATRVVRFPTNDGKITALTGLNQHLMAFDHLAGGELVATVADATTPSELVRITPKKQSKITAFNQAWTSDVYLAQPEEIVTEVNGVPVQGWLLKPRDYTPDSKTPLVVNIHGGPHGQFSTAFFHELQLFAARGWGLLFINPRGSVGFGEAFAAEVSGAWGIAPRAAALGGKCLAEPDTAPRIDEQQPPTACGEKLKLVEEGGGELPVRSAVDVHDKRCLAVRRVVARLEQPALHRDSVHLSHDLFGLGKVHIGGPRLVERRDFRLLFRGDSDQLRRRRGVSDGGHQLTTSQVIERHQVLIQTGQRGDLPVVGGEPDHARGAAIADERIDCGPIGRPAHGRTRDIAPGGAHRGVANRTIGRRADSTKWTPTHREKAEQRVGVRGAELCFAEHSQHGAVGRPGRVSPRFLTVCLL